MQQLFIHDKQAILDLIKDNPYVTLFINGDMEQFGFDAGIPSFYGRYFNEELQIIVMRYEQSVHVYSASEVTSSDLTFIKQLCAQKDILHIMVGEDTAKKMEEFLKGYTISEVTRLSVCEQTKLSFDDEITVHRATVSDAGEIAAIQRRVFPDSVVRVEQLREDIKNNHRWVYFIKEDGKIVTVATATAFTNDAAMIIGVGTLPDYTMRGYATICVTKLCEELHKTNRGAVLFYNNPKAGSIYHKIGFRDQENYFMNKLKK